MHVRCPHCHDPIELVEETPLSRIGCPSCGSDFSLLGEETLSWGKGGQKTVGHFQLIDQIGVGGFGRVWKAYDTELHRTVAVKIPRTSQLSPTETEQFLREARAAAQLTHPNIVGVHEVGRDGNSVYIVSDYIQGLTLNDWLTGHELTAREAAELCAGLAEALHHAHKAGVIHRDLKPGNIMLDRDSRPHIMDFGLARRETGDVTMTIDGKVLGTPAYMSPEQARGEAHHADRRTDLYSLGVILFELLTGHKPFRGNARMLMHQVIHDEPPSPRKLNSSIPRDLETICLKCLRKEPGRRYQTARDLGDDLRRWLNHEPIKARPVGHVHRFSRWCRRNPLVAALSCIAVLLLAAVAVVSLVGYVQTRHALGTAQEQTEIANQQREKAHAAQKAAEETLADTYTFTGLVAGERDEPAQAALWFAAAAQQSRDDEDRRQANQVRFWNWSRQTPLPIFAVQNAEQLVHKIGFHPHRPLLLVHTSTPGTPHWHCTIWNFETGEPLDVPDRHRDVIAATWTPDGASLAVAYAKGTVEILHIPSGEVAQKFTGGEWFTALEISRDGRYLAVAGKHVRVWDLQGPEQPLAEFELPDQVKEVAFNSRGDQLATVTPDGLVRVFAIGPDAPGELPFSPLTGRKSNNEPLLQPVFVNSDDGLLAPTDRSTITWWDAGTGSPATTFPLNRVTVIEPSSDGRYVFLGGLSDGQFYNVATRRPVGQRMVHLNQITAAAFDAPGRTMLTVAMDRRARLWNVPSGFPLSPWIYHTDNVLHGELSPDGMFFATAQADGLVRVWKVAKTSWHREIQLDAVPNFRLRMAPGGRYVMPGGWNRERQAESTRVYDVTTGQPAGPTLQVQGLLNDCDFAPNSPHAVTLSSLKEHIEQKHPTTIRFAEQEGWIEFWNWKTGEQTAEPLRTPTEPIRCAYSPEGTTLAVVCAAGEVLLIDPLSAQIRAEQNHGRAASAGHSLLKGIEFAPNSKLFVTCGLGNVVQVWETQSGKLRYSLQHDCHQCWDARFSPDGRFLLTASEEYNVKVWDIATGKLAAAPLKHPDMMFRACFSPEGRYILTAGRDNSARLWEWRSGKLVCPALPHSDEVFGVAFSHDGRWLLTTCRNRTARFWEGQTGKPVTHPMPLSGNGYWGYEVAITPDGRYAIVAGSSLHIYDLHQLLHSPARNTNPVGLRLLAELLSAQRTHRGGVVNLTSAEWMNTWHSFQERFPNLIQPRDTPLTTK